MSIRAAKAVINNQVLERSGLGVNLDLIMGYVDNVMDFTSGNPFASTNVEVPPCVGAYICCQPQTMKDILNGNYKKPAVLFSFDEL